MNDFDDVRVQLDAERKLTIELVGAEACASTSSGTIRGTIIPRFLPG